MYIFWGVELRLSVKNIYKIVSGLCIKLLNPISYHSFIFKLRLRNNSVLLVNSCVINHCLEVSCKDQIRIVHTLKMCTSNRGPEHSLFLFCFVFCLFFVFAMTSPTPADNHN